MTAGDSTIHWRCDLTADVGLFCFQVSSDAHSPSAPLAGGGQRPADVKGRSQNKAATVTGDSFGGGVPGNCTGLVVSHTKALRWKKSHVPFLLLVHFLLSWGLT